MMISSRRTSRECRVGIIPTPVHPYTAPMIPSQARSVQPHEAARSYVVTRSSPAMGRPACPILAAMNRPRELTGTLLGGLLIATASMLAGCMATRYEAPPEVVPQPPAVTTSEVLAEDQQDPQRLPDAPAPASEPESASEEARRVGRFRPTGDSIADIRQQRAAAASPLDFRERLDHAHDLTYVWLQSRVEALDHSLAASDRPLRPVPAAPFRLGLVGEAIDRNGTADLGLDANFDIALRLPNLERRLRIFITSGELDEAPRSERSDQNLSAGFRYEIINHVDFDLGVRIDKAPVAFAALKWSREIALGRWDFYPFAKIFAETKDSVGYAAAVTFDRWAGRHLLRTSTYAKWRADTDNTKWSESLIYARTHQLIVPDRYGSYPRASDIGRGWGVRLLAGGQTASSI